MELAQGHTAFKCENQDMNPDCVAPELQLSPPLGVVRGQSLSSLDFSFSETGGNDDQLGFGTPLLPPPCESHLSIPPTVGPFIPPCLRLSPGVLALFPFCQSSYLSLCSSQHLYLPFCHYLLRPSPCLASVFLYSFCAFYMPGFASTPSVCHFFAPCREALVIWG